MKALKSLLTFLLIMTGCFALQAAAADIQAGKQKAATCNGCHGADGNSNNPQWPSLAGQQAAYLSKQLKAFRDGSRKNPVMQGMAGKLTDADIDNLAAYFASLKPKSAGGDKKLAAAGKNKFSMCMGCHGADATGRGIFPRLAGQQPAYLARQLKAFKTGSRKSGPMQAVAANLSDQDIAALTAYLGTLQ